MCRTHPGEKVAKTRRYQLAERLSASAERILLLTATPHSGDPSQFAHFLRLLDADQFPDPRYDGLQLDRKILEDARSGGRDQWFLRRIKEELRDREGNPLFTKRHARTVPFELTWAEKRLYDHVTQYINRFLPYQQGGTRRSSVALARTVLQRRLASSLNAIHRSLERRATKFKDILQELERTPTSEHEKILQKYRLLASSGYEDEEREGDDLDERQDEAMESFPVALRVDQLRDEVRALESLVKEATTVMTLGEESKLSALRRCMEETQFHELTDGRGKLLIFTEHRDTLEYLRRHLQQWGYTTCEIHGGMNAVLRREAAQRFHETAQVCLATEAAGEGINLQFCHLMINYDIPWNPNRLEQRMGRIHRYGQTKEVYVFNLVAENTREGKVLVTLFEKLDEIRNALQTDKVFDVISEVLYGKNLSQLMLEAAASARDIDEILREIDVKVDEQYISKIKENLGESLATRYIDYTRLKEMAQKARENRLIPEYTEAFFKKAFTKAAGRLRERKGEFLAIESVPYEIKSIANENGFKKRFGSLLKSYPKITFDKDIAFRKPDAEFVSFGHPLFEAVLDWVESDLSPELQKGAVFVDPEGKLDGYIMFYEGEVKDGTGSVAGKSLFAYYYDARTGEAKSISPTVIWDLTEGDAKHELRLDLDPLKSKVLPRIISGLNDYMHKLLDDRNRQAKIKEKYGLKSLDKLVVDMDGELIRLYDRKERGENVDLAIRNKEEQKRKYERSKEELEELISKEKNLTMSMPVFVGIVRARPSVEVGEAMKRDEEIERRGMEIVMRYERDAGRHPEDVSKENLGFDIRSKDKNQNVRYIEVKARATVGAVALTQNEWFKAQRLADDYYLCVVWNAGKGPKAEPIIIQNPAANLNIEEKVEVVRYIITASEIEHKGG